MPLKIDQLPTIDVFGPAFGDDPDSIVIPALDRGAFARSERGLEVLRYKECVALLRDQRLAANHMRTVEAMGFPEGVAKEFKKRMLLGHGRDDYRKRVRQSLMRAVGASAIENQRPMIRQLVRDLLQNIDPDKESDLLNDYAFLTPASLFCLWFGRPMKDAPWIADKSDRILKIFTNDQSYVPDIISAYDELFPYVQKFIDEAMQKPKENLLGNFISDLRAGHINEQELFDIAAMFNEASTDNTAHVIAMVIGQLLSNQDHWQQIVDQPELIPAVIHETIRLSSRSNTVVRFATEDLEYGGVFIPEGMQVNALTYAGHRDPMVYEDPLSYNPTRKNVHNLLDFGGGAFSCLGMHVALIEIQEALIELVSRYPNARIKNFEINRNCYVTEVRDLRVQLNGSTA
jgi:cytochrome P450